MQRPCELPPHLRLLTPAQILRAGIDSSLRVICLHGDQLDLKQGPWRLDPGFNGRAYREPNPEAKTRLALPQPKHKLRIPQPGWEDRTAIMVLSCGKLTCEHSACSDVRDRG